jgi:hypothetical protein
MQTDGRVGGFPGISGSISKHAEAAEIMPSYFNNESSMVDLLRYTVCYEVLLEIYTHIISRHLTLWTAISESDNERLTDVTLDLA